MSDYSDLAAQLTTILEEDRVFDPVSMTTIREAALAFEALAELIYDDRDSIEAMTASVNPWKTQDQEFVRVPPVHNASVQEDQYPYVHARCSCGWAGEDRRLRSLASRDARRHMHQESLAHQ